MVVATATTLGKDLWPRIAARLGAGSPPTSRINVDANVQAADVAGNVIATVELEGTPRVVSVRATAFDAAAKEGSGSVEKVAVTPAGTIPSSSSSTRSSPIARC